MRFLTLRLFVCVIALLVISVAENDHVMSSYSSKNGRREIFVFSTDKHNWRLYDWSKITTIVEFGYHDDELVKFAHARNVTVAFEANFNKSILYDLSQVESWVSSQIKHLVDNNLDGINVDFEDKIDCSDFVARKNFVELMQMLKLKLKSVRPNGQLSIDVAWSPMHIDNRCYEYNSLSSHADIVFVMAYDERSQIFGPCVAWANSPYRDAVRGVKTFIDIGVPKEKIVLGVPWYGYDYDCLRFDLETETCVIREVPFRGVPCSDAAGVQVGYSAILALLNSSLTSSSDVSPKIKIISKHWDEASSTPYFSYLDLNTGVYHQVWYDDFLSLTLKYAFARSIGLAGVGFWEADSLDYSDSLVAKLSRVEMWEALPSF